MAGKLSGCGRKFRAVVSDGLFTRRAERVAIAFPDANEFRPDHAVLIAVEEYQGTARTWFRFQIRVKFQCLKLRRHCFAARFADQDSSACPPKEIVPLIESPATLPE